MGPSDFEEISEICKLVYPAEAPYTLEELEAHHRVFPQVRFVALYSPQGAAAGVHFTLRLLLIDFHRDDPWDVLTAGGRFSDHNPVTRHTLYGADIMVHPVHQHHRIAHALTDITRILVREEGL
jgi:hypothetical protein